MRTPHATGDGTIAYDDTRGTGPLVLCLPGLGDLRSDYRHLTPLLVQAGHRVVTVDLRGHGESPVGGPKDACEARIGEVDTASLVVMGGADPDFPDPTAEAAHVADRLGGSFVVPDDLGHHPHAEDADRTALRSAVHGFCTIETAGGFGLPVDVEDRFRVIVDLLIAGLRASSPPLGARV